LRLNERPIFFEQPNGRGRITMHNGRADLVLHRGDGGVGAAHLLAAQTLFFLDDGNDLWESAVAGQH
jgi:hypothetical protein